MSKDGIRLSGAAGYDNMLRFLNPHTLDCEELAGLSGTHHTAETIHFYIDDMLPFKRLQRWSLESKEAWVFAYL